jgi:hypothetical protein
MRLQDPLGRNEVLKVYVAAGATAVHAPKAEVERFVYLLCLRGCGVALACRCVLDLSRERQDNSVDQSCRCPSP